MKIELEPRYRNNDTCYVHWLKALPFFANPRGVLVHRVKHAQTILHGGIRSHDHVNYWCGNGCNAHGLRGWTDRPDRTQVLCEKCEQAAVDAGMPASDELAGRHVHVGRAKAVRTCCHGIDSAGEVTVEVTGEDENAGVG